MMLELLTIERIPAWRNKSRPLTGVVKFSDTDGTEITLPISEAASQKILALCAEGMVQAAGEVARLTAANIIEQVPALENKVPE